MFQVHLNIIIRKEGEVQRQKFFISEGDSDEWFANLPIAKLTYHWAGSDGNAIDIWPTLSKMDV